MKDFSECPLAMDLAERLRQEREGLINRWLDRISARVTLAPGQIFPTRDILDHVPLLVDGIADYLEDPAEEITADVPVVAKAMELGEMRLAQGFDVYQILKEYEILGGVLFDFMIRTVDDIQEDCTRGELLVCGHRVFRSISVIQQYTTTRYMRLADERVEQREEQLRNFNRAVSHELKNQIGAASGAASMLQSDVVAGRPEDAERLLSIVQSNVQAMNGTLVRLTELSRLDREKTRTTNIRLTQAAAEAKRQLRKFAEDRNVVVELADHLPDVEVPAAAVELALSNYLSNAIKYRDPSRDVSWARIEGRLIGDGDTRELEVWVTDNGLGVPEDSRDHIFRRYYRAHDETVTGEEGTGLGLSLVRDNIEGLGGRVWAEFPDQGSRFGFAIPCVAEE
ncbi:MAG TPA: sensor histidine kinase [Longimicrobiales bacterium]|nr:sensor histidine kinase [Longimicrobiales bacterium]